MKPFDLESAKRGDPVCTREGLKARIICFDANCIVNSCIKPIIALVEIENSETIVEYSADGLLYGNCNDSDLDLFMTPKTQKLFIKISKREYDHAGKFHYASKAYIDRNELIPQDDYIIKEIEIEI